MKVTRHIFGFHLIEVLITLALAAILCQWMLGSYQYVIAKERRREAEHNLISLASALEEYAIEHSTYAGATLRKLHFPSLIAGDNYELEINYLRQSDYLISTHPLARQAELDKRCGVLLLSSTGEKSVTGSGSLSECW